MAKAAVLHYSCSECGYSTGRWLGRCPSCASFGTLVEEGPPPGASNGNSAAPRPLLKLAEVEANEADRIPTGVAELDRVLGGGLVPASLVLVGGEPGVGKSTLLLSALASISKERRALLVTGEESPAQVKLRAARLGGAENVEILAETNLDSVCATLETRAAGRLRDRLHPDAVRGRRRLRTRLGLPGARGGGASLAGGEGVRGGPLPRRARDEGRLRRGAACAGAPRRLRPAVRRRPLPRASHPASGRRTASARRTSSASSR